MAAHDPDKRHNFYAGAPLDRADHRRVDQDWLKQRLAQPGSYLVPVWQAQNLLVADDAGNGPRAAWPAAQAVAQALRPDDELVFLGLRGEQAYFAVDLSDRARDAVAEDFRDHGAFHDLRGVGPLLAHWEGAVLAYARGMVHWHGRHRHCGLCGSPTESVHGGHVRKCLNRDCEATHFPRTDPAVIMLVHDGGARCVLGRQKVWPAGMHSTLAGFVEPGESLEDAVAREVMEEVGLVLGEIRYHSSQPWPFPASLMLGFSARADGGEIAVREAELEAARWFTRAELRNSPEDETLRLPRRDSIARRLIEDWLAED